MPLTSYIPPRFRFLFQDANGRYLTVVASGAVVTSTTPQTRGVKEPEGWKDTEIKWARSQKYWGLITTLTTSYKFVEDGAKILRHIYYTQGIEGKCRLIVQKRKRNEFTYDTYYAGDVNFATFQDERDFATVDIEEGGLTALFRANEDSTYEITAPQDAILMDGVQLRNKSIMQVSGMTGSATNYMPNLTNIRNESDLSVPTRNQSEAVLGVSLFRDKPFFVARGNGAVSISYTFKVTVGVPSGSSVGAVHNYVLVIAKYNPTSQTSTPYYLLVAGYPFFYTHNVNGNLSIPMTAGEQLFFFSAVRTGTAFVNGTGNTGNDVSTSFSESIITLSYYTRVPESTCGGARYHEVVSSLMSSLSNGTATVNMPFLTDPFRTLVSNRPFHTRLATAESVRMVPGSKYKLKFSDLFQDMHGRWLLGLGIVNNTITIAPLTEFFQNVQVADLGIVKNLQVEPAEDLMFSEIKVGMKAEGNDALNGRFEITAPQDWKMPLMRTNNIRNASSPFIGGMYSIEQIRNQIGKDSTNTESDNRIIVLETGALATAGKYPLYRPQDASSLTGLSTEIAVTAFNLTLRPKLDLLRNKPLLSAVTHNLSWGKEISFLSAEREGEIEADLGDGLVADRAVIGVPSLGSRPFIPIRFRFTATVPDNLYQLLATTPNGYFRFRDDAGIPYKGFVDEISQHTGDDAAVECSLLAHPDTDLTTLIR